MWSATGGERVSSECSRVLERWQVVGGGEVTSEVAKWRKQRDDQNKRVELDSGNEGRRARGTGDRTEHMARI